MKLNSKLFYILTILVVALATVGVMLLLSNVTQRKEEATQNVFRVTEITEETIDPAEWGKNYPRQYDSYQRTVDTVRTRHGGSEAFQKLDEDPVWREIFAGYAFGVDYREDRGHAYMLSDQDITERIKVVKQPGACLHCHSAVLPAYQNAGVGAGVPNDAAHRQEAILKGFELVSAMPYTQARTLVDHPISCGDCHDPDTMQLRVTRPGFLYGIQALAQSEEPLPHLPSIERWRTEGKKGEYEVNTMATRQEMRSFVCGQCHVEYYFKGDGKLVTYPWAKGLNVEEIEAYYDEAEFKDWQHKLSGALVLKAQHPEFEMWSQGIHARSGVACADCHMPYQREGAIKVSDHHVRSPLLNVANACQTCHNFPEEEMRARAEAIQDRTLALMDRAEEAVVALIHDLQKAQEAGIPVEQLAAAQALQRKAQWRLDYVSAENSMGFHAPQESARILGEAIDYARQGQLEVAKLVQPVASR
ncbi:MAG: ammonia-forming cytochrome c nitrite reductase subunit c552 [Anaerolineae bacterium]|nr:ammonia-forming cytochrome c nitrite reductase subunit c552 [Anaerolineales bacterium]MCQ3977591.1 ammonia-forming cytochrome c nitrite reductase subunit c552 [Anaerolineae bacterium]